MEEIAESFSTHNFADTFSYLSDEILWNNIGGELVTGKQAIMASCDESLEYLSHVQTNLINLKSTVGQNSVVIETLTEYIDTNNTKSTVASCDVYDFTDGKLVSITSYNIEVKN